MSRVAITAKLVQHRLANTPGEAIVARPGFELWQHPAKSAAQLQALCTNFYHYGRTNGWIWDPVVGINNQPRGLALVEGRTNRTNCGGFNSSVRWLAENVLGFGPNEFTSIGATTPDMFITRPGVQGIDAGWVGNVRTMTQDFPVLKAFRFTAHSWNRQVPGLHYDASTNTIGFNGKYDLMWCVLRAAKINTSFAVTMRVFGAALPGPGPVHYCLAAQDLKQFSHLFPVVATAGPTQVTQPFINAMPTTSGAGNWTAYLLVSRADLPPAFVTLLV